MSTLKTIRALIELRMRNQNSETIQALPVALRCVNHLHARGAFVQQVTVRRDHVVIDIDKPQPWLQGAIHVSRVNGMHREVIRVAQVLDCQVQWVEREPHPLLRREG